MVGGLAGGTNTRLRNLQNDGAVSSLLDRTPDESTEEAVNATFAKVVENIDGFMVIERIRANDEEVPILATSTQNDLKSKQRAFNAGCDDYLVKPVDLNELALRLSALLRRMRSTSNQRIVIGNAALDSSSLTVTEGSNVTALPPKEFLLLFKLCASPGRIFTRRDIMDDIWGIRTGTDERTVDVHIRRLRKRFEESASIQIETVRGVGYRAKATKVNS